MGLIRLTLAPFVFALLTATLLLLAEVFLPSPVGLRFLPFPLTHIEDRDSYASFLSTISGIGGVLIALYYTGMVAVASATYSRAPGALRALLLREPIGKLYIKLVAFTTFLSLCLLAFFAQGFSPIRLAFPLLIILSGVTILSFVQLGQQAFNFFDPTRLSDSIFLDLDQCLRRATATGRFWDDPSFQSHANQQADYAIKALETLADFSIANRPLRSDAVAEVAISTIGFLYRYEASKKLIPTNFHDRPRLLVSPLTTRKGLFLLYLSGSPRKGYARKIAKRHLSWTSGGANLHFAAANPKHIGSPPGKEAGVSSRTQNG